MQLPSPARAGASSYPSERELSITFAPIAEITRARRESIPDYCRRNKIALVPKTVGLKRKRRYQFFATLEEARAWQVEGEQTPSAKTVSAPPNSGPLFGDVIDEWRGRCYSAVAASTRISYDNYHDDPEFRIPIKSRHRLAVRLNRNRAKAKDLKEEAFLLFRESLRTITGNGETLAALATVQYYQALRISEAAALHWEDIDLDWATPSRSRIRVMRLVVWPRKKGLDSFIQDGFNNAKSNEGVKEQPMFPETFEALSQLHRRGARGPVFTIDGCHLEYRAIQSAYDRAFRKAGLPFTGTHVMRHGGCRRVYNQDGDLAVAQQLLGNSDPKSTLVYAKRDASALTEVAERLWQKKIAGCLQSPAGATSDVEP